MMIDVLKCFIHRNLFKKKQAQFSEASKKVNVNEDDLIKDLPPPPNVVLNCIQTTRFNLNIQKINIFKNVL